MDWIIIEVHAANRIIPCPPLVPKNESIKYMIYCDYIGFERDCSVCVNVGQEIRRWTCHCCWCVHQLRRNNNINKGRNCIIPGKDEPGKHLKPKIEGLYLFLVNIRIIRVTARGCRRRFTSTQSGSWTSAFGSDVKFPGCSRRYSNMYKQKPT